MKKSRKLLAFVIAFVMVLALVPSMAFAVEANEADGFDYDAFYTIENGYGQGGYRISTLGYPDLNNNGDIFHIGVNNASPGSVLYETKYDSFCANGGSRAFAGQSGMGCAGYYTGAPLDKHGQEMPIEKYLAAFNYIVDLGKGNLEEQRIITQTVIWALLGSIDINDPKFEATNLSDEEKAAVTAAVNAAESGYVGDGTVVDVVFMTCELHHDYADCQPQILPLYGDPGGFVTTVSFIKMKLFESGDTALADNYEFGFDLYKMDSDGDYSIFIDEYFTLDGIVTATDLEAGSYVFKEKASNGWVLDIAEDGLYFEIVSGNTMAIWKNLPKDGIVVNKPIEDTGALEVSVEAKAWDREQYEKTTTIGTTLTSWVGDPKSTDKKAAGGYTALGYIDNNNGGFTTIKIDAKKSEIQGPFNISYSGHGNPKFQDATDKIGVTYTVEVKNGKVIVTFDDKFVSCSIAYGVYSSANALDAVKWAPGKYQSGGHKSIANGVIEIPLPAADKEGNVWLAIHSGSLTFLNGTFGYRDIEINPYEVTFGLTVLDSSGKVVDEGTIDNFGTWGTDGLAQGEYEIRISDVSGKILKVEYVTVKAGETASVSFEFDVKLY